jgi:c-di-GMP-binding flagellar brake protein YcgR
VLPKINQTTYLQPIATQDEESASTLRSRVADLEDDAIWLEIPLDEKSRKYYRPKVGEQFRIFYFTPDGIKRLFLTEVTGLRKESIALVSVRKPGPEDIRSEQRRNFLRVDAQLELAVRAGDKVRFTALTDDVGGGGLSFRTDSTWPMAPGASLSCWLLIQYRNGHLDHAKFNGEVVRVEPVTPEKNLVMVRYQDIQEAEQQKIIRYCFERQLDMHRR